MKKPKLISIYDLYCDDERDGYGVKQVPALVKENILTLVENHNMLVQTVKAMADRLGIEFEDEED